MRNTLRRKQNPYLFLKIGEERERLRRVCVWTLCLLRRFRQRRQWIVTKDWGKAEKGFVFEKKNCLIFAKHAIFATETSHQPVAKTSRQNTQSQIYEKKFLSVFRDWKSHSWGRHELSRENLYVPLVTGPFISEQVAKTNLQARGWSMRLGWLVTKSPKQGNTVFEIFQFL